MQKNGARALATKTAHTSRTKTAVPGPTRTSAWAHMLPIQASLKVNSPGDRYEQEADRVADSVMRMPDTAVQRTTCSCGKSAGPDGMCLDCKRRQQLRRKSVVHEPQYTVPPEVEQELARAGRPLDPAIRAFMESRLGHDLGDVRVHTDSQAAASAEAVQARAYTVGHNIVFGPGRYAPLTSPGKRLLAHEITHVLQNQPDRIQRDGPEESASVELCFVPIRRFQLGEVGGVHAVLNVHGGHGIVHAEVSPGQHTGVEDPAGVTEGAGRAAGLHSHVVIQSGTRSQGSCQTIPVTQAQANEVISAAGRYESMDVAYEAPGMGPNSNSFGEWALLEAGIDTTTIDVPAGALGWSWYLNHPGDRRSPPRVARTYRGTAATCDTIRGRANSFRELIDLVRDAETELINCGVNDVGERVNILRGIYYGTPWSRDYGTRQQSHIRNQMFNVYSGTGQPRNPLECMDCGTFLGLSASQDLEDSGSGRHVDVGHLLIGMDARRSWTARNVTQPIGQVTGLEAATWAGDLGGGAAQLAMRRATSSDTVLATRYFRGSNYGGSINIEGDVAGYAVGAGPLSAGDAPALVIASGDTIADTLEAYFFGDENQPAGWNSRCTTFLTAVGGTFDGDGNLSNRSLVKEYLTEQTHDFGCWYMVNFQRQHSGMNAEALENASRHIVGASEEIAEVFLAALEHCAANPGQRLGASRSAPTPSPPGDTSCGLARAVPEAERGLEAAREFVEEEIVPELQEQLERAQGAANEAERWIEQQRRQVQRWWRDF